MKKVLVLYYTQTGQLKNIVDSVCKPFFKDSQYEVDIVNCQPQKSYLFPWTSDVFFNTFPEARMGIPCAMKPIGIDQGKTYDLVIFAYQVWYLSPSIPAWSVLQDVIIQDVLKNTPVVTLLGVRNMWVEAHKVVHKKLKDIGAYHIGNIVLTDPAPNLVSALTIIRWLMKGQQEAKGILPRAGVPVGKIKDAELYGQLMIDAIDKQDFSDLQNQIVKHKGVSINYTLKTIEANGYKIFLCWAKFILKKGGVDSLERLKRVTFFKNYLLFMLFILSPFVTVIFVLIYYLFYPWTNLKIKNIALLKKV